MHTLDSIMIYRDEQISIFFGDKSTAPFSGQEFKDNIDSNRSFLLDRCSSFPLLAESYIFLRQVHGIDGKIFNRDFISFDYKGDFIITIENDVALGVLTADCLPIVFFDTHNSVISIAHSGWKGSIAGVVDTVINSMKSNFASQDKNIKIFLGPAAKKCCYTVTDEFLENSDEQIFRESIFKVDGKLVFDNVLYTCSKLKYFGILEENINLNYNLCTICCEKFCSNRRGGVISGRQVTLVKLNNFK